jgi:hypothetical protein
MTTPRDSKLTVMVTATDMAMLKEMADADDVSVSQMVRTMIRLRHASRPRTVAVSPKPRRVKVRLVEGSK